MLVWRESVGSDSLFTICLDVSGIGWWTTLKTQDNKAVITILWERSKWCEIITLPQATSPEYLDNRGICTVYGAPEHRSTRPRMYSSALAVRFTLDYFEPASLLTSILLSRSE